MVQGWKIKRKKSAGAFCGILCSFGKNVNFFFLNDELRAEMFEKNYPSVLGNSYCVQSQTSRFDLKHLNNAAAQEPRHFSIPVPLLIVVSAPCDLEHRPSD